VNHAEQCLQTILRWRPQASKGQLRAHAEAPAPAPAQASRDVTKLA